MPCLKFTAFSFLDVLFFVSLTFLAHEHTTLAVHRSLIESIGLRELIIVHMCWAVSLSIESLTHFLSSRMDAVQDLKVEAHRMMVMHNRIALFTWMQNSFALIVQIMKVDSLIDFCEPLRSSRPHPRLDPSLQARYRPSQPTSTHPYRRPVRADPCRCCPRRLGTVVLLGD